MASKAAGPREQTITEWVLDDAGPRFLSRAQAGRVLGKTKPAVQAMVRSGALESIIIDSVPFVLRDSVLRHYRAEADVVGKAVRFLKGRVRHGKVPLYGFEDVMDELGLDIEHTPDKRRIRHVMSGVAVASWRETQSHRHGPVLLSAVVHQKSGRLPESFFEDAKELVGRIEDRDAFVARQLRNIQRIYGAEHARARA